MDFLPFQKTIFRSFRRLNDNGDDKLVLSHRFSDLKGESIWFLALGHDNMNITRGVTYTLYFGFMGGATFIEDLGEA